MRDTPIHLLLVEDNSLDVRLLREILKQAPFEFVLSEVGYMREAESRLATNAVDIILLDLGLPDAQRLEAVRRARAAAPRVPLIVLTGCEDELVADQALQEGAQDFLVKGQIETAVLLRTIRYATQRMKAEVEMQKAQEESEAANRLKGELLAELQAAHAETQLFLRSIPSILIGVDSQGRITHWNLTATSTFGIEDSIVVGRMIEDCGIRWLHPEIKAEIARWLATEFSYRSENQADRQNREGIQEVFPSRLGGKAGHQSQPGDRNHHLSSPTRMEVLRRFGYCIRRRLAPGSLPGRRIQPGDPEPDRQFRPRHQQRSRREWQWERHHHDHHTARWRMGEDRCG